MALGLARCGSFSPFVMLPGLIKSAAKQF